MHPWDKIEMKNVQNLYCHLIRWHGGDSRIIKQVQRRIIGCHRRYSTIVLGHGFSTDTCNYA